MKKCILVSMLVLFCGCLPATQMEVQDLTNAVSAIVPVVREAVRTESGETQEKIEIVLGRVEEINAEVATAEDPIDAIETGWGVTEAWNPYYGYGVLALGILRLFQGKKKSEGALEEVVIGIADHKKGTKLKDALNATQSMATRKMVDNILG